MTDVTQAVDTVELALRALLRQHPGAFVGAVTGDATVRLVALPDAVPVGPRHRRIEGFSPIHLVATSDQAAVARTWSQARAVGHAWAPMQLAVEPPLAGQLHLLDLRHIYGVMVMVFTEGEGAEIPELSAFGDRAAPGRLARMLKDGSSTIIEVDRGVRALLGWEPHELVGRRSLELVHPDDQELAIEGWVQLLEVQGSSRAVRLRHRHRDGQWVWIELHNHNQLSDPDHACVVAQMVDISEEVAAQEAVLARQQLLEHLAETLPIGLFHADPDGRLLYANQRLTEITGLGVGASLGDWPGLTDPQFGAAISEVLRSAGDGVGSEFLVDMLDRSGALRHCSLSIKPLTDRRGRVSGVTGAVGDVTRSVIERRELQARAATDPLTGCLNRSATVSLLQQALDRLQQPDGAPDGVAVIFVDVDGLKELNDRMGHFAGDSLLSQVSRRLSESVRTHDAVGRFGGDEFVILALHVQSVEQAMSVARWVAGRTLRGALIDGETVQVRASLGVAWTDRCDEGADALIRRADAAMYRSKRDGRCEPVLAPPPD